MGMTDGALRDLALVAEGEATAALSDEALVGRFLASRGESSERAFAALVERHGPMVREVCRRVLRDSAEAGDAFQATFLVLARKAGSVRVGGSLAPWLHGVSVRVARRARAVAARRNARERTNAVAPEVAAVDDREADELRASIDDELRRLPDRYGRPLVLFYLEGLGHEEVAGRLGCPVGTVRSRLSRGRDLLRDRLTRRGLAPSTAAPSLLIGAFAPRPPSAVEAFKSMAQAASRLAAGRASGGMVPPAVLSLVAGVSRMMTLQKLAPAAAVSAACVLGALGLTMARAQQDPPAKKEADVKPAASAKVEAPAAGAVADPGFVGYPAFAIRTNPPTGSTDVDPALAEISVTWSRDMIDGNMSWVTLSKESFPEIAGKARYEKDKRTCVAPVKLQPGKTYAIFLNSQKFTNFKDVEGRPAVPYLLVFKTRAAR